MDVIISIIVPVYNVEKYLSKCIDSILNQTFTDFEVLLINDGSTDSSGQICDDYAAKDRRIKVIHQKNQGQSTARNTGLDLAQGEYIGFVDSDDYIDNSMYEILYQEIMSSKADLVLCSFDKVYEDGTVQEKWKNDGVEELKSSSALMQLDKEQFLWNLVMNKLYSKKLFHKVRFKEGIIFEDMDIMHHIIYTSKHIRYVKKNLYHYFQRTGSTLNSPYTIKRIDKVYVLSDRIRFAKEIKNRDFRQATERLYVDAVFLNYMRMRKEIGLSQIESAIVRKDYNEFLPNLLLNPFFGVKHKIALLLFSININMYDKLFLDKE